jgi:Ni/Co efflux regulator RcnB
MAANFKGLGLVCLCLGSALVPVWADPPQRREHEGHQQQERKDRRSDVREHERFEERSDERSQGRSNEFSKRRSFQPYFQDDHRLAVREYYAQPLYRCPPGLAKKHNGCMPPGQARLWRRGYVLPREVIYYDVEPVVLMRLGPPPSGHRFVRVAGDILLIAIGTGLVIDAIEDLAR